MSARAKATIQEGIESGEFNLKSAELGKALLLGAGLAGILDIVQGRADPDFPEELARHLLLSFGVTPPEGGAHRGQAAVAAQGDPRQPRGQPRELLGGELTPPRRAPRRSGA